MQFYIVHKTPVKAAKMLPLYALRVNLKEGKQIISDIGHRFGVTFDGRNKHYNKHHPWTRTFSHRAGFLYLIDHYRAVCIEYYDRTGKLLPWQEWFAEFDGNEDWVRILKILPISQESETIHYLTTAKANKMKAEELKELKGVKL